MGRCRGAASDWVDAMKKISAKVRDEAATICAACASEPRFCLASSARVVLGYSQEALTLAVDAWCVTMDMFSSSALSDALAYAEAEALLRTGWTP